MKYFKNTYCSALITITILLLSLIINVTTAHAVKYKKFNFSYIPDKSYPKLHIYAKDGKWVGATSSDLDFQIYAQSPDIPPGPHTVPSQIKVVLLAAAQQDLFLTVPDGKDNTTYISRELTAALNSILYKVPDSEITSLSQRTASAISSARKIGESTTGKFCGEKICLRIVK